MKLTVNLQSMVLASFILHVVLLGVTSVAFNKRHSIYVPSSVKVNIIAPKVKSRSSRTTTKKTTEVKKSTVKPIEKKADEAKPLLSTEEIKMLENRISDIESRKKTKELEEMIEQSVGKVTEMDVEAQDSESPGTEGIGGNSFGRGDPYFDLIYARVKSAWVYTGSIEKDMMTVVSINIDSGGNVRVLGIEQSSGNERFDRSVIRAIKKVSQVPKPPRKIGNIGLRFRP